MWLYVTLLIVKALLLICTQGILRLLHVQHNVCISEMIECMTLEKYRTMEGKSVRIEYKQV